MDKSENKKNPVRKPRTSYSAGGKKPVSSNPQYDPRYSFVPNPYSCKVLVSNRDLITKAPGAIYTKFPFIVTKRGSLKTLVNMIQDYIDYATYVSGVSCTSAWRDRGMERCFRELKACCDSSAQWEKIDYVPYLGTSKVDSSVKSVRSVTPDNKEIIWTTEQSPVQYKADMTYACIHRITLRNIIMNLKDIPHTLIFECEDKPTMHQKAALAFLIKELGETYFKFPELKLDIDPNEIRSYFKGTYDEINMIKAMTYFKP